MIPAHPPTTPARTLARARALSIALLAVLACLGPASAEAAGRENTATITPRRPNTRVVKVLPHLVDKQGRVALSPSLYERDAYQAHLRKTPAEQGGLRFDVQWKSNATNTFTLRVEVRGNNGNVATTAILEEKVKFTGFLSTWTELKLSGDAFTRLGELAAWRASLWDGPRLVAEQKSFLW